MRRRRASRSAGFTYVGLIVLVAIIGLVGAATLKVDTLLRRVAAEQELLEIGATFSEALRTYAEATPRGQPTQPPSLQELLKDPRFPALRRHLRKVFVDPVTGKAEWGIVWVNPGSHTGVLAVYSLSQAKPFKVANFDARFSNFENKDHISEWKFAASGQAVAQGQVPGQATAVGQGNTVAGQAQAQPSLFAPGAVNAANAANAVPPAAQTSLFAQPVAAPGLPPAPPPEPAPAPPDAPPADPPPDSAAQDDTQAKEAAEAAARDAAAERR